MTCAYNSGFEKLSMVINKLFKNIDEIQTIGRKNKFVNKKPFIWFLIGLFEPGNTYK